MTKTIDLSVIIVNYNSAGLLQRTVESVVKNLKNISFEIIIVDNNSSDNSISLVKSYPFLKVLNLNLNLGFSKANNIGVKYSKGKFLYFLNPDAFLLDFHTEILLQELKKNDKIGIIAPQILNTDGSNQFNARMFPNFRRIFNYTFGITKFIRNKYICDYKLEFYDYSQPIYPDWVSGAAFLMEKVKFEKVLGFSESYFLFYEDVDLCKKVKDLGYQIKYFPTAKVEHIWGGTSENLKEFTLKEEYKSRFKYFKKHHNKSAYVSILLLTASNIILRIIFFALKGDLKTAIIFLKSLTVLRWKRN